MGSTLTPLFLGGKRSRTEIIRIIISVAQNGQSAIKIMKEAHLNSKQLKLYSEKLAKLGLIEVKYVNGKRVYTTTQKGFQYLKQYDILRKFLK